MDEACRLAGLPDRIAHDLRRTAVRNLERVGMPRSASMKMTGHKTESVYDFTRSSTKPCCGKAPRNLLRFTLAGGRLEEQFI